MDQEQRLAKYWDEENKLLEGVPCKLPEKKADDKEAVGGDEMFLRLPQGISPNPKGEPIGGILHRFPSTGNPAFKEEVLVAALKTEKKDRLLNDVLLLIHGSGQTKKAKDVGQQTGRPLHFDAYHVDVPNKLTPYLLYFFLEDPYQVAIIFVPSEVQPSGASVENQIDYSLASLLVGGNAGFKLRTWKPPVQPKATGKHRR
jgi:hypothetical protein